MSESVEKILGNELIEAMSLSTSYVLRDVPEESSQRVIEYLQSRKEFFNRRIFYSSEDKSIVVSFGDINQNA